jgi:hypothetical protein
MSETTTPVKIIKTSAAADLDTIRNVASGSLNPRTAFALSKVRAVFSWVACRAVSFT